MSLTSRTIIVPDSLASLAAALTAAASPAGGGMFLSALGTETEITHRFSSGLIGSEFAAWLPLDVWDGEQYQRVQPGEPETIAAQGAPLESVQALLAAAVVTAEDWQATARNLGLGLVAGE